MKRGFDASKARLLNEPPLQSTPRRPVDGYNRARLASLKMLRDRTHNFLTERSRALFDQVTEVLFDKADDLECAASQTQYFDAIKLLRADRHDVIERWLSGVSAGFDNLGRTPGPEGSDGYAVDNGPLSLLGDDDLEEIIAFDVMVSAAVANNHGALHLLQRRVAALVGAELNLARLPFSPEVIAEQFALALRPLDIPLQPKLYLLKLFQQKVLNGLDELLDQSNRLLVDLGILPDIKPETINGGRTDGRRTDGRRTDGAAEERKVEVGHAGPGQALGETDPCTHGLASGRKVDSVRPPSRLIASLRPLLSARKDLGHNNPGGNALAGAIAEDAEPYGATFNTSEAGRNTGKAGRNSGEAERRSAHDLAAHPQSNVDSTRHAKSRRIPCNELMDMLRNRARQPPDRDTACGDSDANGRSNGVPDSVSGNTSGGAHGQCEPNPVRGIRAQIDDLLAQRSQTFADLDEIDQTIVTLVDRLFSSTCVRRWVPDRLVELFARIELPATQCALADPSLFDRDQHPVRRLLNEVAAVANGLQGTDNLPGDPLYRKLEEVIERLQSAEADLGKLTDLLSDFIKFVEADRRRIARLEQRVMEQEAGREKINEARRSVEDIVIPRMVGHQYGYAMIEFVEKAWSRVLFIARLKYGTSSEQWARGVRLLDQLLALETVEATDEETVDRLLGTLGEALADISYEGYEVRRMLDSVRRYLLLDKDRAENLHPIIFDKSDAEQARDVTLRVLVDSIDVEVPGERLVPEETLAGLVDESFLMQVDSLKKGAWVELTNNSDAQSRRCRLLGVVKPSGNFVFGDRCGQKVTVESRGRLAIKLKEGKLIVLDNSHLFDDALAEVIHDARDHSTDAGF